MSREKEGQFCSQQCLSGIAGLVFSKGGTKCNRLATDQMFRLAKTTKQRSERFWAVGKKGGASLFFVASGGYIT